MTSDDDTAHPGGQAPQPADEEHPFTDEQLDFLHSTFDQARNGRGEELLALVAQGIPVNLATSSGDTYVMLAAYHGHARLVRDLAAAGADVDRLNARGQSPLAGAVFKQDAEVVRALLEAGADPDAGTPSARATATYFGLPAMTALLDCGGER